MTARAKMSTGKDFQLMIVDPYNITGGQVLIPLKDVWEVDEASETDEVNGIHGDTQSFVSDNGYKVKFTVLDIQSEIITMLERIYNGGKTFTANAEDSHKMFESNACSFTDKREFQNGKADRGITMTIKFPPDALTRKNFAP